MNDEEKPARSQDTPYDRFERLLRRVISVPKTEVDRREAEWKKQRKGKKS